MLLPIMCEELFKTSVIHVDSYDNSVLNGRIVNPSLGTQIPFHSTMDFIKQTETLLETLQFPQAFAKGREFVPRPEPALKEGNPIASAAPKGQLATFSLRVMFRQNATWQGSLTWTDTKQEHRFRSALELLRLIDSALVS